VIIPLKQKLVLIIGLWVLIWIGYSSSLTASWHMDDISNIVRNEKIHLSQFDLDSMIDTFFAGATGKLYRPIPMASFALNWYYSGAGVLGFHLVNIFVHCLNGLLLFVVVLSLLQTPRLSGIYSDSEMHWIALLASLFWALNPVQTQAVTYIVQRMASMAALFYLAGIYLYLRYKNTAFVGSRIAFLGATVASYLLAILSKENAALFPISIYLIETIFFAANETLQKKRKQWIVPVTLVLFTLVLGILFFVMERGNPLQFIENLYANRPFSALQRLLTEPRVLLFYLSLLFVPVPARLSLCHDITVSNTLFEPWTTLPAIFAVFFMVSLCFAYYRKKPLITFACLFFFLNHGVESTILPLELVFEHRNYLPSFFIFLPIASFVIRLYRRPLFSNSYGHYLSVGTVCLIICLLCNWTFARNMAWQSERSLWEEEISKNPQLARPYHNLAWGYYQSRGQYEEALTLYKKALTMKHHSTFEVASTLNNMGRVYYLTEDYDQALHFFEKSIHEHPQPKIAEYQIVMTLIQLYRWQDALKIIDSAIQINEFDPFYYKLKGIVQSKLGNDAGAATALRRSLIQNPDAVDTRAHLSLVLSRAGRFEEAIDILSENGVNGTTNPHVLVVLSKIEKQKGNLQMSNEYLNRLIRHQGIEKFRELLLSWRKDNLSLNIDYDYYLTQSIEMGKK